MIKFENVTKTYKQKDATLNALKNVSFDIKDDEIFGIIGMSGAGKSTLLRLLATLEAPSEGNIIVDDIDEDGFNKPINVTSLKGKALRKYRANIGVVFQGFNLLKQINVFENIAFPLRVQKWSKERINERVTELLELVGLQGFEKHYPSTLSGGQAQRVAIARALATSPRYLLLDEITSALDPIMTRQVIEFLKKVQKETQVTMILITHEMNVVRKLTDRVIVLYQGEIVERGNTKEVFENPRHEITKLLLGEEE